MSGISGVSGSSSGVVGSQSGPGSGDLAGLSGFEAGDLGDAQIKAILAELDLDIANVARGGKFAALKYDVPGAAGRGVDRAANLKALLEARRYYEGLLSSLPGVAVSRAEFE